MPLLLLAVTERLVDSSTSTAFHVEYIITLQHTNQLRSLKSYP